jgi:hypothetical protein
MPWKTMDVREQRVSFVVTANRGEKSLTALCQEFGISRPTGYLWLSRYRQEGLVGIAERSRRAGEESGSNYGGSGRSCGSATAEVSGLGSAQTAGAVAATGHGVGAEHDPPHSAAAWLDPRAGASGSGAAAV